MNKRIEELSQEAERLADAETSAFTDDSGEWTLIWNSVYDKIFAKLIIEECVHVARVADNEDKQYAWAAIQEHFGIKE